MAAVLNRADMAHLRADAQQAAASTTGPWYEYTSVMNCEGSTPDTAASDAFCAGAYAECLGNTPAEGQGPSVRVYRREVDETGAPVPPGEWDLLGVTCLPELVPGDPAALTMDDILRAFRDTDFAVPDLRIEPRGNVTLVTLPTYFELVWPDAGFAPGEVDSPDPATMLGFHVDIKPTFNHVVYHFGDGSTLGPTDSLGGPYPDGDVVHEYARSGEHDVSAEVEYGGEFRVNGGNWIDIPGTVTVSGAPQTLAVKTARNRLYTNE